MTVTDSLWIPEMAKILDEEFRPLGNTILELAFAVFSHFE